MSSIPFNFLNLKQIFTFFFCVCNNSFQLSKRKWYIFSLKNKMFHLEARPEQYANSHRLWKCCNHFRDIQIILSCLVAHPGVRIIFAISRVATYKSKTKWEWIRTNIWKKIVPLKNGDLKHTRAEVSSSISHIREQIRRCRFNE